jgi:hypothetical protein
VPPSRWQKNDGGSSFRFPRRSLEVKGPGLAHAEMIPRLWEGLFGRDGSYLTGRWRSYSSECIIYDGLPCLA